MRLLTTQFKAYVKSCKARQADLIAKGEALLARPASGMNKLTGPEFHAVRAAVDGLRNGTITVERVDALLALLAPAQPRGRCTCGARLQGTQWLVGKVERCEPCFRTAAHK